MKIFQLITISLLISCVVACHDDIGYDSKPDVIDTTLRFTPKYEWQTRSNADSVGRRLVSIVPLKCEGETTSDSLFLHIYEEDMPDYTVDSLPNTRASFVNTISQEDPFSLTALKYKGKWDERKRESYFFNEKYSYDPTAGQWAGESGYKWPGVGDSIRFYGVIPYSVGENISFYAPDPPKLMYFSPYSTDELTDVLAARTQSYKGNLNKPVDLTFEHILTSIVFQEGEGLYPGYINSLTIENVPQIGSYDFETRKWSAFPSWTTSYTYQYTSSYSAGYKISGREGTPIGYQDILFMIPREKSEYEDEEEEFSPLRLTMKLDVEGEYNGATKKTTLTFGGDINIEPKQGKNYILKISTKSIVTNRIIDYNTYNGEGYATQESIDLSEFTNTEKILYKYFNTYEEVKDKNGSAGYVRLGYTLKYYGYNASTGEYDIPLAKAPDWLTIASYNPTKKSNPYPQSGLKFTYTKKNTGIHMPTVNKSKLRSKSYGSQSDPYDLSVDPATGNQESANTYIVDGCGYFKIPASYGNTNKNGKLDTSCISGLTSTSYWQAAKNYFRWAQMKPDGETDINIITNTTSPYIYDIAVTPGVSNPTRYPMSAEVIWESAIGLITELKLSSDNHYLTFSINQALVAEGNALIALKNDYGYLWSWHIWVTPRTSDDDVTYNGVTYMGILGTRDYSFDMQDPQKFRLEVVLNKRTSTDEDKSISYICIPPSTTKDIDISLTPYQFGRPTPLSPTRYNPYKNSSVLKRSSYEILQAFTRTQDDDKAYPNISESDKAQVKYTIQYPQYMNAGTPIFSKTTSTWSNCSGIGNLWFGQNPSSPKKTPYDPCPRGYRIMTETEWSNLKTGLEKNQYEEHSEYPYCTVVYDDKNSKKCIVIPWTKPGSTEKDNPSADFYGWKIVSNILRYMKVDASDSNTPRIGTYSSTSVPEGMGNSGYTIIPVKE